MVMVHAPARWTAEMVRELPEDRNRYEVIGGELIVSSGPSWTHQEAVAALFVRLRGYLRANNAGHVIAAPADIEFNEDTLVQPDIFVVPRPGGRAPQHWQAAGQLFLVVEVISPSSARIDRVRKRELYLSRGAPQYWVVDCDARLIERWRADQPRPEIAADVIQWQPAGAPSPFVLDLAEYFGEVLDE